ncbi:MAG TPA: 16S rRNA (uracil(1498)-N(3))-methyltransferase [Acetobacteraceae bacterium]|nr:16S rRNA (uracil(1498)-N(3))-methyltransferase [Acetobacteraceae bacterium]
MLLRLFVSADLGAGIEVVPTPGQAHYLGTVMRRGTGDAVALFNGADGEWLARIATLRKDRATLIVERMLRPQSAEPNIWLAFALLKRDATDLVVQKATELGVSELRPLLTMRTLASRVNLDRLRAIATEAAEQSERLIVPGIAAPQPLTALLADWPAARRLIAAVERQAAPAVPFADGATGLLVGPEGGFTETELENLLTRPFVSAASLGPRILRAETACIVGLAQLQVRRGD